MKRHTLDNETVQEMPSLYLKAEGVVCVPLLDGIINTVFIPILSILKL